MTHDWPACTVLELAALPGAVPCTRLHAKVMLLAWGLSELSESVELAITELTSNAVKITTTLIEPVPPPVRLRLSCDGNRVLVEVWDASPQPPIPAEPDFLAESGRGLHLVAAVSSKWGYHHTEYGGKVVWCEFNMEHD